MVDFTVKNQDLIDFLIKSSAKGVISISNTEKVTATFFNKFLLEAIDNKLEVKALDTQGGTMWAWHTLNGVEVNENGIFAVTDADLLLELLKSIGGNRMINFVYMKDEPLTIFTVDEGSFKGFELREWVTMTPKEMEDYTSNVIAFIEAHSFNEDRIPIIGKDPKVGTYSTILRLNKTDLLGVILQSIKLTKDQHILVNMDKEGNVNFKSGKENANIKSKDLFRNVTENPIIFEQYFGNLQPIIPHLFDSIVIYMRKASDGGIKWWIRSKVDNIELNFITGAVRAPQK
jgi:hypothetical protein